MSVSLDRPAVRKDASTNALEKEIQVLEVELRQAEANLNTFTNLIRSRLAAEITQLNQLTELYKAQKKAKKDKRQAQKKRGKNYQEPKSILCHPASFAARTTATTADQQELKRLYKEAIVRVHPDKFVNEDEEKNTIATDITSRLNDLYQSGELDLLRDFHEHILSGNAMSYVPSSGKPVTNPQALVEHLEQRKKELKERLSAIRKSRLYEVLTSYDHPATFIEELRPEFEERILVMKKRTRN
jgi:hypothetical protein